MVHVDVEKLLWRPPSCIIIDIHEKNLCEEVWFFSILLHYPLDGFLGIGLVV